MPIELWIARPTATRNAVTSNGEHRHERADRRGQIDRPAATRNAVHFNGEHRAFDRTRMPIRAWTGPSDERPGAPRISPSAALEGAHGRMRTHTHPCNAQRAEWLGKPDISIGTEHACASAVRMRGASGRASGQEADAWFDQTPTLTTDIHSASSRFRHRISTSRHPPEPYRESARVVRMRGTPNARGRRGNPRRTSPAAHRTPALTLRKHSIFRRCAARLSTPLASYSAAFGYPHLSNAQRVEWFRCRVVHTGNCGEICCRRIRRVDSRVCSYCSPHAGKPRRFGLRRALTIRMHSISSARKGRLSTSVPQRRIRRGGRRNAVIPQSTG